MLLYILFLRLRREIENETATVAVLSLCKISVHSRGRTKVSAASGFKAVRHCRPI